jgi:hypothetical protein
MRAACALGALALAGCNLILGNGNNFASPVADASTVDVALDACASCMQVDCASLGLPPTSLSGHVYMPDGVTPIANATVYVPATSLATIADGAGAPACASGAPIVRKQTDATGYFKLDNVPSGTGVPFVVQVGKWRRDNVTLDIPQCTEMMLPAADTRLPQRTTEGHIPRIAITTGASDSLECIMRDIGVDPLEIGTNGSAARVHLYTGNGTSAFGPPTSTAFAAEAALFTQMTAYDIIMLGCRGVALPAPASVNTAALKSFTDLGGWAFLTHFSENWLTSGPSPWPSLGTFANSAAPPANTPVSIDVSTASGQNFASWVVAAGASATAGTILLTNGRNTCSTADPAQTQRVMYLDPARTGGLSGIQSFTWSTAAGGRVTFTDMHASNVGNSMAYPAECQPVTVQEKAIMFQLFDVPPC